MGAAMGMAVSFLSDGVLFPGRHCALARPTEDFGVVCTPFLPGR
jgi:hypothetical protein